MKVLELEKVQGKYDARDLHVLMIFQILLIIRRKRASYCPPESEYFRRARDRPGRGRRTRFCTRNASFHLFPRLALIAVEFNQDDFFPGPFQDLMNALMIAI